MNLLVQLSPGAERRQGLQQRVEGPIQRLDALVLRPLLVLRLHVGHKLIEQNGHDDIHDDEGDENIIAGEEQNDAGVMSVRSVELRSNNRGDPAVAC